MTEATVLIAAWNAAETIRQSVQSAFHQSDVTVSVLVADDCSHDETPELAQSAGATVLRCQFNGGPSAARNLAIDAANGHWLAVLDADDTMAPGRLRRMIDLAGQYQADIVLGNLQAVDISGVAVEDRAFLSGPGFNTPRLLSLEDYLTEDLKQTSGRSLGYLKPLVRRDFLNRHGIRYDPRLRNGEDCHLVLNCFAAGARVLFAPQPDYLYMVRSGSISHRLNPDHIASLLVADRDYAHRNAAQFSPRVQTLLRRRRRALTSLMVSEAFMQDLKALHPFSAFATLARHPSSGPRIAGQLFEAANKRFRFRRKNEWKR